MTKACLGEASKLFKDEAFLAEPGIEGFNVAVLPGTDWLKAEPLDAFDGSQPHRFFSINTELLKLRM